MLFLLTLLTVLCASNFVTCCAGKKNSYIFSLNSENFEDDRWTVENNNGSIKISATVPGGIYSDLMNSDVIGDIYFKDNDVQTRWVAKDQWTYKIKFNLESGVLEKSRVDLVFDGLDTIAHITLNDHPVGSTENMFVKYKFNVKYYLKEGVNELSVKFDSPVEAAANLSDQEMIPPKCVPSLYNGECHANQLRKMQASFSWDWGPAFPSVGMWKPVYLEAYNSAIISEILTFTEYHEANSSWTLTVQVYMDTVVSGEIDGDLQAIIALANDVSIIKSIDVKETIKKNAFVKKNITMSIPDADIRRWWPNGYGEQHLSKLTVSFQSYQHPDEYFYKDIKIGFRTLELIQDTMDDGLTFYFKINGHPLFMKGSNWIPGNILPEKGYDKELVDDLLGSAKDVHMNMLRVWGGGVYESDYFYEKCDELGLLIWQDMMFACSMYPANSNFLNSVSTEIEQNVRRLQHHPSIALWAGNNENELALRDNWYGTQQNFTRFKMEYIQLYVETIRPIVQQNDPSRPYAISSPNNGLESEKEGFIADKPGDPRYGDTHYYNYVQDLWSMDTYSKTRFCSEYGYQSIPSIETLLNATDTIDDIGYNTEFMNHREHSPINHYWNMKMQVEKQFGTLDMDDPNFMENFQYLTQAYQAWAYKTETEFYRQSKEDWMTMGALYWQLNDVWQAPTWSGIEFGGHWKILHYHAKDFFSPVLVSPRLLPTNQISVHLINDRFEPVINGSMTIDTFQWDSLTPIKTESRTVEIMPLETIKIYSGIDLPSIEEQKKIYYRFSLKDTEDNHLSPYNYIFPAKFKDIEGYAVPNITFLFINVTDPGPVYSVDVKTDGIGLFVWVQISHDIGWFSENGFILSESVKRIQLYTKDTKHFPDLKNKIKLRVFDPRIFAKSIEVRKIK